MSRTKAKKTHCYDNTRKNCPEKPFVQVEGELTEAQLEVLAGAGLSLGN